MSTYVSRNTPTLYYSYRQLNRLLYTTAYVTQTTATLRRHSFRSAPTILHTTDYQPRLTRPAGSQTNHGSHMKTIRTAHSMLSSPPDNMAPARIAMKAIQASRQSRVSMLGSLGRPHGLLGGYHLGTPNGQSLGR